MHVWKEGKFWGTTPSIPDPMGNDTAIAFSDFENSIYWAEDEGDEDCEVPRESLLGC